MAAVTKGTALKISFGDFAYAGYVPEDGLTWAKPAGNQEDLTDENGDMMTKIIMDPRDEFSMDLVIKDSGGSVVPPIQGATITITDPNNSSVATMCNRGVVSFARGASKLSVDLVKETSMTYS